MPELTFPPEERHDRRALGDEPVRHHRDGFGPGFARRRRFEPAGAGPGETPSAFRSPAVGAATGAMAHRAAIVAGVAGAFIVALLVRTAFLDRSYDVYIDEVTYFLISRNLASGLGVTLHGQPFFLHPPLFFFIEAPFIAITHPSGLLIDQILGVRLLNAGLGAATAVVLLALATRIGGWRVGAVAFVLFTFDPFIIKMDSRNLLEVTAMLAVLLGYLALAWRPIEAGPLGRLRVVLVGVAFGAALLTKEMTAFLTLLPLGILFVTGAYLPRRTSIAIAVVALLTYGIYPVTVVLLGLGPDFASVKFSGLLRFVGIVKTTGFVRGGPSFTAALVRNLDVFVMTYGVILAGVPAAILLAWNGTPRLRVIGVLGLSAYGLLAYSIGFGTLEEQFFYFLVLPAILTVPLGWSLFSRLARREPGAPSTTWSAVAGRLVGPGRRVLAAALVVCLAWSALIWVEFRVTPDDGYRAALAYLRKEVPNGSTVGVTTDPQEFLFQGYRIERIDSVATLTSARPHYAVISSKQVEDGYTRNGVAIYAWLRAHATRVYVFSGRSYGRIEIYRVAAGSG